MKTDDQFCEFTDCHHWDTDEDFNCGGTNRHGEVVYPCEEVKMKRAWRDGYVCGIMAGIAAAAFVCTVLVVGWLMS